MQHQIIRAIDPGSPLEGVVFPGDELLSINGHPVQDVLDYKYYSYERTLHLQLRTPTGEVKTAVLHKELGGDAQLSFESYLMDRPRQCANRCVFCFVDQMPPGMRKSLYFKDDDTRLSFLMGCYITLTNLSEREIQRIMQLHISPINISVHTTAPELRERMLQNPRAGQCFEIMQRFAKANITMNCQIVCCPGWNDGAQLQRTMVDLARLHPAVHSVAIVPVGLTRYREHLPPLTPFNKTLARKTVRQIERFGDACLEKHGSRIFYPSDELYLRAALPLHEDDWYGDYPQLENGVGMLRLLVTEFLLMLQQTDSCDGVPFTIACGRDVAPVMRLLTRAAHKKFPQLQAHVCPIRNDFFGERITVTGLVTGRDLLAQLKNTPLGQRVLISWSMLRRQEVDFLDDLTLQELSDALGVPVYPIESDGAALCDAMCGLLPAIPTPTAAGEQTPYWQQNK